MNPSILIIEDDASLRRGLQDNFCDAGYRVRVAIDGEVGLNDAIQQQPDLVLLDIMLPEMNGYHVCREIRRQSIPTRILMLTAKGQEDDVIRGLETGADDYVTKPFSIRELLARSEALLRRDRPESPAVTTFGAFRLNSQSGTLTHSDSEIPLTAKELGVLCYLAKHAGQPRTRRQILETVWQDHFIVTQRSVDRCITTLRRKIEEDSRRPRFIRTVRDVGYRFVAE